MKSKYYHFEASPPPRHWYQRRVGIAGKVFLALILLGPISVYGINYSFTKQRAAQLSAATSQGDGLKKVTASTIADGPAENIVDVQFVLDKWANDHPGETWSVSAKSIEGPQFEAQINADASYKSASIYRLMLALPLFSEIPAEHQQNITVTASGAQTSLARCVDIMIRLSDAACARSAEDYISKTKAEAQFNKHGMKNTEFMANGMVRTTASDTTAYMASLYGDALPAASKNAVLRLLREQVNKTGIPVGCPGCIVANKSDPNEQLIHDTAIMQYKSGTYVLTIFSDSGDYAAVAQLAGKIQQKIVDTTTSR